MLTLPNRSIIPEAIRVKFDQIEKSESTEFSKNDLYDLHQLLGPIFDETLHQVDKFQMTHMRTNYRVLIDVVHKRSGRSFKIHPGVHYCQCAGFQELCLQQQSQVFCVHLLVVQIAKALKREVVEEEITEDEFDFIDALDS